MQNVDAFRDAYERNGRNAQATADELGVPVTTLKSWPAYRKLRGEPVAKRPARILFLDIETKPAVAYVWRLFDETISLDQLISPGGTICFGAKWGGERKMHFYSDWEHGHEAMILAAHKLLSEADAVVTYNGDKFDLPKLRGEFLAADLPPPPPATSIDVYKSVRKLGLQSNKLAFVGPFLKLGSKIKHEGFSLWTKVMDGDPAAQRKMERYCAQDVRLLEEVYQKVMPYIGNHPHLGANSAGACGACGSHNTASHKPRRTKAFQIEQIQCQDCGSWQDGKRSKAA